MHAFFFSGATTARMLLRFPMGMECRQGRNHTLGDARGSLGSVRNDWGVSQCQPTDPRNDASAVTLQAPTSIQLVTMSAQASRSNRQEP